MKVSCSLLKNKNYLELRIYFLRLNPILSIFFVFVVLYALFLIICFSLYIFLLFFMFNLRFEFFHIFFCIASFDRWTLNALKTYSYRISAPNRTLNRLRAARYRLSKLIPIESIRNENWFCDIGQSIYLM